MDDPYDALMDSLNAKQRAAVEASGLDYVAPAQPIQPTPGDIPITDMVALVRSKLPAHIACHYGR